MFENLIRELEKLKRTSVSIPIEADGKGYLDRQCPSKECLYQFKVLKTDWKDKFKDEAVFCPMCCHSEISDNWQTIEQMKHAKNEAVKYLQGKINRALKADAQRFNLNQRKNKSFI